MESVMQVEKDVFVPMRDGVALAIDIFGRRDGAPRPAVLLRTPYVKDGAVGPLLGAEGRPRTSVIGPRLLSAGRSPMLLSLEPLVEAGYVVVVSDTRGTGYAEGVYDYYNFEGGPYDGYDSVEWIAAQPWCDGNVGMLGSSAGAILCYIAALTHPPHLRAMVANMHPADFYFDQWFVGGVFRYEDRISWCTSQTARIAPLDPGDPEAPAYERKRRVYVQRYEQQYRRMAAGKNPVNLDWAAELYGYRRYDAFWKRLSFTPRLGEIDVPVLHGGVWHDHFIRGTLASHAGVNAPKRLFVGPGGLDMTGSAGDGGFVAAQVRWFDHFLRGRDNGVLEESPARLYLTGAERWTDFPRWPVVTHETPFYLSSGPGGAAASRNDGLLLPKEAGKGVPDEIAHDPAAPNRTPHSTADQRSFEAGCLTYTTEPLEDDLRVIGTPRLVLYASSDAADVDWCVRLCDVLPDGRSRLLNFGALKGSHLYSHEQPAALEPGRVYEFPVEIWASGNVFLRGHRIRLDVSTSDFPCFEINPLPSRNRVYHDAERPSRLILPVAGG
jgi:putative CocE/NonD family hydrolase